jgi:hypothetical protein
LAGESPTALENLLAQRIVAAWLAPQHADLAEAVCETDGIKVTELRIKRLDAANKRYLMALKALAMVRRLTNGLKIEVNHVDRRPLEVGPAAITNSRIPGDDGAGADNDPVRDQIRDFFRQDAAQLKATR